jgi:hypothetical protein
VVTVGDTYDDGSGDSGDGGGNIVVKIITAREYDHLVTTTVVIAASGEKSAALAFTCSVSVSLIFLVVLLYGSHIPSEATIRFCQSLSISTLEMEMMKFK